MKKSYLIYLLMLAIPLLFSCVNLPHSNQKVLGYDDEEKLLDMNVKDLKLIPLESINEAILTNPQQVEIHDTIVYVLDNNRLLAFNIQGNFLRQIGQVGNGNHEYLNIATFTLKGHKELMLFDTVKNKILVFHPDGTFIKEIYIKDNGLQYIQRARWLQGDVLFCYHYLYNDSHTLCETINLNTQNHITMASVGIQTGNTMEYVGVHPFVVSDSHVRYIRPFDNKLYGIGVSTIEIETSKRKLSQKEIDDISNFSIMTYAEYMDDNVFLGFSDIYETADYIILSCRGLEHTILRKSDMRCHRISSKSTLMTLLLKYLIATNENRLISILPSEEIIGNEFLRTYIKKENHKVTLDDNCILVVADFQGQQ